MSDKRNHCRAKPPFTRGSAPVTAHLSAADYRLLYEQTMRRGISMADTIRQLVREAADREAKVCAFCEEKSITNLDGEELCRAHADAWCRGEAAFHNEEGS